MKRFLSFLLGMMFLFAFLDLFVMIFFHSRNDSISAVAVSSDRSRQPVESSLRSRSALAVAPVPSSTSAMVRRAATTGSNIQERCMISCYSKDGIGHQMEGKLSCIATAAALNLTYVHIAMDRAEHGADASTMEAFFGIGRAVDRLSHAIHFDNSTMSIINRRPLPYVGRCHQKSFFDDEIRSKTCAAHQDDSPLPVFTADNCWDYFWCKLAQDPDRIGQVWRADVGPILQKSFLAENKDRSKVETSIQALSQDNLLSVVVHLRRGDAIQTRGIHGSFYTKILDKMQQATADQGGIQVVVHSDGTHDEIVNYLNLSSSTSAGNMTILDRDSDITIDQAIYQMITSDVFVASKSSLSHTAALLRNGGPVIHPETSERPGMVGLGWYMMKERTTESELEMFTLEPVDATASSAEDRSIEKRGRWVRTDETFWSTLVQKGRQDRTTVEHIKTMS